MLGSNEALPRHAGRLSPGKVADAITARGGSKFEQITAEVALPLLPTGEGIIRWIATNRSIRGVGARTARRLWTELGRGLYSALENGNAVALAPHVGATAAGEIIAAFALLADELAVLKAYDKYGVDPHAAMAACALWGRGGGMRGALRRSGVELGRQPGQHPG